MQRQKRNCFTIWFTLIALLMGAFGCGPAPVPPKVSKFPKIKVVATTGMLAEMAKYVGGIEVEVTTLVESAIDPTTYELSPKELRLVQQSDIFLIHGLGFEKGIETAFEEQKKLGKALELGKSIDPHQLIMNGENTNPYVWLAPELWSKTAPTIVAQLSKIRPSSEQYFQEKADEYQAALLRIDKEMRTESNFISKEKRVIVTSRNSFQYFARAYDWAAISLETNGNVEPDPKIIAKVADQIIAKKLKCVFTESTVSPYAITLLQNTLAKKGYTIKVSGPIFSESLGTKEQNNGTFISSMRSNMAMLQEALQ